MSSDNRKITLLSRVTTQYPELSPKECQGFILCGQVRVNGEKMTDPRRVVPADAEVAILRDRYVSRGGLKLEKALDHWDISPEGKVVLDAGSSTGGFTDCLLQRGACLVHAVDVGYNQLDYRLRRNDRVVVRERTNIMAVTSLDPLPDFAVADLSFRSLRRAATHIFSLCKDKKLIALIKPQFEWINPPPRFDGIVREGKDLVEILLSLARDLQAEGVRLTDLIPSPIRGNKGNKEFLGLLIAARGVEGQDDNLKDVVTRLVDPESELEMSS